MYGLILGYLSLIGSTLNQMESVEVPAKPECRCRAAGECTIDNEQCTMGGGVKVSWAVMGGVFCGGKDAIFLSYGVVELWRMRLFDDAEMGWVRKSLG